MRWLDRGKRKTRHTPDDQTVRAVIAADVAIASALPSRERESLIRLTTELIAEKRWEAIGQIELTDEVIVTIAANAAIPILSVGIGAYRNVRSILVHATTATSTGLRAGPSTGVVSDTPITTVGQATPNDGPLLITWPTARADSHSPAAGRNVVIHEFAHKIDMLDGYSDGTPPLAKAARASWAELLEAEYGWQSVAPTNDPLRTYAFTNPAEFFAVSTEAFFCTPDRLHDARQSLYNGLASFYGLDPMASWNLTGTQSNPPE